MRTSGRTNRTPGWPGLHRAGPRGGKKKHIKRGAKGLGVYLSPMLTLTHSLSSSCVLRGHALMPRGCIFSFFFSSEVFFFFSFSK